MPTPTVTVKMPKSSRATYSNGIYAVTIDASDVMQVLGAIDDSISPLGLMEYLRVFVSPYFADQIVNRFAGGGDGASGMWLPLAQTTIRIRHALGYTDDDAINERTGELLHWLTYGREFAAIGEGASMTIPDATSDHWLTRKLETAQFGRMQSIDEMIPGAYTPPRPVLAVDSADMQALLFGLELHIINFVAGRFSTP